MGRVAGDLRRLLGDMPRGPAVHVCLVPDQVAHLPPGTRRNARGEAGRLRGVREQPAISFHRRDVLSDPHLISLREILLSVSRLSPVPRSRGGRTGRLPERSRTRRPSTTQRTALETHVGIAIPRLLRHPRSAQFTPTYRRVLAQRLTAPVTELAWQFLRQPEGLGQPLRLEGVDPRDPVREDRQYLDVPEHERARVPPQVDPESQLPVRPCRHEPV
jgi:hypothetical protein